MTSMDLNFKRSRGNIPGRIRLLSKSWYRYARERCNIGHFQIHHQAHKTPSSTSKTEAHSNSTPPMESFTEAPTRAINGAVAARAAAEPVLAQIDTPPVLFTIKRKRKPENWEFISLVAKDDYRHLPPEMLTSDQADSAYCAVCKCIVQFSKGQTSSVGHHMRVFHQDSLAAYPRKKARTQEPLRNDFVACGPVDATMPAGQASKDQQAHLKYLIAKWLSESQRPLSLVEDLGFAEVIDFVTKGISGIEIDVPSRTTVTNEVHSVASQLRASLKARLQRDADFFSATTDIWTDRGMRSFMALTVHYLEADFTLNDWTLEVEPLPGKHTGAAISAALGRTLTRWGLSKESCVRLVRDGAANAVAAANQLGVTSFSCIAHSLHLVVSGAMIAKRGSRVDAEVAPVPDPDEACQGDGTDEADGDIETTINELREQACQETEEHVALNLEAEQQQAMASMREIVQVFRALAIYFRNSSKARNRLEQIRNDVQKDTKAMFALDCPTRWSSCWDMLAHFVKLQLTVETFFAYLATPTGRQEFDRIKLTPPTAQQWFAIRCLLRLLEPFALAVEHLSGSRYPTLSVAFSVLRFIKNELMRGDLFDEDEEMVDDAGVTKPVKEMMENVQRAFLKLFRERFRNQDTPLLWISYLDPRLTDMDHLTNAEKEYARFCVIEAIMEIATPSNDIQPPMDRPSTTTLTTPVKAKAKMQSAVFGRRAKQHVAAAPTNQAPDLRQLCEHEFDKYLRVTASVDAETDPLEWWQKHAHEHVLIAKLARKWLCCVATSVPSERAFSTGGNVVTAKRCALAPNTVRDTVFISHNAKLGKPN